MAFGRRVTGICILHVLSAIFMAHGVEDVSSDKQKPTQSRPVNLFIINGMKNEIANASVTSALKTLREKFPDYLGQVWIVQINETDIGEVVDNVCYAWSSAISQGGSIVPDLVLDLSTFGISAEGSSSITAALGLPTLSAQYGQKDDIKYWRNLDVDQKGYLIQVMPPADLVPEVIRQIAILLNITNAAVLFDKNFVMNHKYKSLLLNVPTRHVINEMEVLTDMVRLQLSGLRDFDVVNYFLLGDKDSISMILDSGESLGFTGNKYGWFVFTLDDEMWPSCSCDNITVLFLKPQPPVAGDDKNQAQFAVRESLSKPSISSAFYYDLTLLGVRTMKSALDNGEWPLEPHHINCDSYNGTNRPTRGLDLLTKLIATSKNMTPTYAGINWGVKNGEHHAAFTMNMYIVNIEHNKITSKVDSGIWEAGIETPLQASRNEAWIIHNIGGVFLVIFVGIVFACLTLAIEYWYYRHRAKVSDLRKDSSSKTKIMKAMKPIRFNLHPAPTHGAQPSQFRSRF